MTVPKKILIEVRSGRREDLEGVVDLWQRLARHHELMGDEFALAWRSRDDWSKYIKLKFSEISTKLIVAEEEGRIVGFMLCMLSPNAPIFRDRKIGLISDAFVVPERRRKGVAEKMLDMGTKWFRKNKVRSVQLMVAAKNLEGRTAWRKLGFKPYMMLERLDLAKVPQSAWQRPRTRVVRRKIPKRKGLTRSLRIKRGPS